LTFPAYQPVLESAMEADPQLRAAILKLIA